MPPLAEKTVLVVAHPDDEALWLSSALASVGRVVFCFGDPFGNPQVAEARRRAVAALPLPGIVDLALPESGAGFSVDWTRPQPVETGLAIIERDARMRYEANYVALLAALRPALTGMSAVYTHNPWGEYGHAEHVQVYRAVAALQPELGFTLWFSNYAGPRSWPLARAVGSGLLWSEKRSQRPNHLLAQRLRDVYRRHGAWTWARAHYWPEAETLYACPPNGQSMPRHAMAGETLLDVTALRRWAIWRRTDRILPPSALPEAPASC